jgi:hydroxyacyl-ACP dehydratase HTD2-like protein with hotdog domain
MSEQDTLEDGYETWFAPTRPFQRRLWTHGSLTFNPFGNLPDGLEFGRWTNCTDELVGGRWGTKRTVVRIARTIFHKGVPPAVIEERYMTYLHDSQATYAHEKEKATKQDPITLQKLDTTPSVFRHTFTPSQFLFTRFAYLSHNFHRIHIDPEYTAQIEGYPGTLMSASLSVIFLLTAFCNHFQGPGAQIRKVQYTFRRPLFVDRPVILTLHRRFNGTTWAVLWDNEEQIAVECVINPSGMSM